MMMSEAFTSFPKYGLSSLSKSCLKKPFLVSLSISLLVHFSKDLLPFLIPGAINCFMSFMRKYLLEMSLEKIKID